MEEFACVLRSSEKAGRLHLNFQILPAWAFVRGRPQTQSGRSATHLPTYSGSQGQHAACDMSLPRAPTHRASEGISNKSTLGVSCVVWLFPASPGPACPCNFQPAAWLAKTCTASWYVNLNSLPACNLATFNLQPGLRRPVQYSFLVCQSELFG
jgi:hypothetical protein